MRLIKKEALKGDASVMQPMIDALNTPVKYVKEPGPQPVNSDVSPLIIAFLNGPKVVFFKTAEASLIINGFLKSGLSVP